MTAVGIVTGAGRGIGAACAARLVNDVDVLILADRDVARVELVDPVAVLAGDCQGLNRLAVQHERQ
jgi:NAD(P)-dependent dehydrogenase (short-subunit alcohol dehydrogenase family)